jgi:hypothetical protein
VLRQQALGDGAPAFEVTGGLSPPDRIPEGHDGRCGTLLWVGRKYEGGGVLCKGLGTGQLHLR